MNATSIVVIKPTIGPRVIPRPPIRAPTIPPIPLPRIFLTSIFERAFDKSRIVKTAKNICPISGILFSIGFAAFRPALLILEKNSPISFGASLFTFEILSVKLFVRDTPLSKIAFALAALSLSQLYALIECLNVAIAFSSAYRATF